MTEMALDETGRTGWCKPCDIVKDVLVCCGRNFQTACRLFIIGLEKLLLGIHKIIFYNVITIGSIIVYIYIYIYINTVLVRQM